MPLSPYADPRLIETYRRIAAPRQFAAPARDLVRMLDPAAGARVLDVGTGTGVAAAPALAAVGSSGVVIGVDASCDMLRSARDTAAYPLVIARVPHLPFPDGAFDVVMAGFVVSHFTDCVAGLAEMARVCRPGGRTGLTAWGSLANPPGGLWNHITHQYVESDTSAAFRALIPWDEWLGDRENIDRALRDAGFASVTVETREYRVALTTTEYLQARAGSVQGLVLQQALTPSAWNELTERLAGAFRERFGDTVEYVRDVHFGLGVTR